MQIIVELQIWKVQVQFVIKTNQLTTGKKNLFTLD